MKRGTVKPAASSLPAATPQSANIDASTQIMVASQLKKAGHSLLDRDTHPPRINAYPA